MDPSIRQLLMRLQRLRASSADGNTIQSFINSNYSILTLHLKCFPILLMKNQKIIHFLDCEKMTTREILHLNCTCNYA